VLIRGQDAACRLLQLLTTYGRKIRGPRFLAGTVAMTTFLFLRITHDPLLREAVTRGEPRIRPCDHDPGAGSSWLPRLARPRYLDHRDTFSCSSESFRPHKKQEKVQCRLTCTGLWTERRTCPRAWRRFLGVTAKSACAWRTLTTFPSSFFQRTPRCHRCDRLPGNEPQTPATDRPRPKLLRHPAKAAGIPWTRVPSTVAARARERIAPLRFPCRPPAHAAHTLPPWLGTMCFLDIASSLSGRTRAVLLSHFERAGHLYNRLVNLRSPRLGLTTQARQLARSAWPFA